MVLTCAAQKNVFPFPLRCSQTQLNHSVKPCTQWNDADSTLEESHVARLPWDSYLWQIVPHEVTPSVAVLRRNG